MRAKLITRGNPWSSSLLAIMTAFIVCGCSAATVVGLWCTDISVSTIPGRTNMVQSFQVMNLREDKTLSIEDVLHLDSNWHTNVSFTGTYVSGTNQVTLKLIPMFVVSPTNQHPLILRCALVDDELRVPKIIPSVVTEFWIFRHSTK